MRSTPLETAVLVVFVMTSSARLRRFGFAGVRNSVPVAKGNAQQSQSVVNATRIGCRRGLHSNKVSLHFLDVLLLFLKIVFL